MELSQIVNVGQRTYLSAKQRLAIGIAASIVLVLILLFSIQQVITDNRYQQQIANTADHLNEYRAQLEYLVVMNLQLTEGLASFVSLNPDLSQQQFSDYADILLSSDHQIKHVAAAKDLIVTHMYPLVGNEQVLGLDYRDVPSQHKTILMAVKSGQLTLAGPLDLIQGGMGVIGRKPISYANGENWGVVSSVLDYDEMLSMSGVSTQQELDIAIRGRDAKGSVGNVFYGDAELFDESIVRQSIKLPSSEWLLTAMPKSGWQSNSISWPLWIAGFGILAIWIYLLWQKYQNRLLGQQAFLNTQESEARFRSIFHKHNAVMMQMNPASGEIIDANEAAIKFYGFERDQLIGKNIREFVQLPDEEVEHELEMAATGDKDSLIFPHKLADGSVRQVEVHTTSVYVKDSPLLFSVIHDITDRIESEKSLKLNAKVFEHSQEGIMITDANRHILAINNAFCEITGYSEEEVLGQTPSILSSGKHDNDFYESMYVNIHATGFWRGEIWNKRKDGSLFAELLSISKVEDEQGEIVNYVAVFSDITHQKQSEEKLDKLAHFDTLTGLANRILLKTHAERGIYRAQRKLGRMAMLFLDLDEFKIVNDSLGHAAGDELLQQVAIRLKERLRDVDTIARLGGDEFVIILEEVNQLDDIALVAQDIIEVINKPFVLTGNHEAFIGTSIGISVYPDDTEDTDQLMAYADAAMYRAKQNGRNTYSYYTESISKEADNKLQLTNQLKTGLDKEEFELYYQPQIDLFTGQITGAEALIRWNHPERGVLAPGAFIAVAEERGIIYDLSRWVLKQGSKQLKLWQDKGWELSLSLNVSPRDFSYSDFFKELKNLIEVSGVDASYLELELTESSIMRRTDAITELLNNIRELGISLALDDFGTGHSSLAYLKHFPLNKLKIDRSFVKDIIEDQSDKVIVNTIINMAKNFDMMVVAEGVESIEQQALLQKLGCEMAQGYYYASPLKIEEFEKLVMTRA